MLEGKVIAVTGGASGIGLALIDMNREEASAQVKALQGSGVEATHVPVVSRSANAA